MPEFHTSVQLCFQLIEVFLFLLPLFSPLHTLIPIVVIEIALNLIQVNFYSDRFFFK